MTIPLSDDEAETYHLRLRRLRPTSRSSAVAPGRYDGMVSTHRAEPLTSGARRYLWEPGARKNSNFMRIQVGDGDDARFYSVFGSWDGLLSAMINVGGGRPHDALRGLSSGVVGEGWNLNGQTFIGEPTRETRGDLIRTIARAMTPFAQTETPENIARAAQGIRTGNITDTLAALGVMGGEQLGLRSRPVTLRDVRDQVASREFGTRYENLDRRQQARVNDSTEIKSFREGRDQIISSVPVVGDLFGRADRIATEFDDYREKRDINREAQVRDDERVLSGEITWGEWRRNRAGRAAELRGFAEAVFGSEPIEDPKDAYERWLNVIRASRSRT